MKIKISSKDLKITPDIQKSVEKKLTQRLRKYGSKQDGELTVTVRASETKPHTRVDIDMPYLNFNVHAEAVTTDGVLGSVDRCMDILDRQIEKYKTRMQRSRVKGGKYKKEILDIVNDDELLPSSVSDDEPAYKIIKVESKPMPMTIDEAVLQMEVLDHRFLFFLNADTDAANVIYKRDDGNIGLIEM